MHEKPWAQRKKKKKSKKQKRIFLNKSLFLQTIVLLKQAVAKTALKSCKSVNLNPVGSCCPVDCPFPWHKMNAHEYCLAR